MRAQIRILRWDPKTSVKPRYRTYAVSVSSGDKVLGALLSLQKHVDPCLSFRFNCRTRHCGECSMMINGRPGLSCAVSASREMTLEPLRNVPLIKDLVIDRSRVYRAMLKHFPLVEKRKHAGTGLRPVALEVVDRIMQVDSCIHCLCCMAVCPAYKKDSKRFPGPAGLVALATLKEQKRGMDLAEKATSCVGCGLCENVCPRQIPILSHAIMKVRGE